MSHDPFSERPRAEPEIIPPGSMPRGGGRPRVRVFVSGPSGRAFGRMPGPFTIAAALVALGLVLGLVLFLALGALLVALPVLAVAVSAVIAFGVLRRAFRRRLRNGVPARRS